MRKNHREKIYISNLRKAKQKYKKKKREKMITYFYVIYCGFNKRRKVKDKKAFPNDFA